MVLTGAGKNFSVGGDLRFMHDAGDDVADAVYGLASTMHAAIEALAALDAPVISVVRGAAAGGGMSIAIAADLVLAAESAHVHGRLHRDRLLARRRRELDAAAARRATPRRRS